MALSAVNPRAATVNSVSNLEMLQLQNGMNGHVGLGLVPQHTSTLHREARLKEAMLDACLFGQRVGPIDVQNKTEKIW